MSCRPNQNSSLIIKFQMTCQLSSLISPYPQQCTQYPNDSVGAISMVQQSAKPVVSHPCTQVHTYGHNAQHIYSCISCHTSHRCFPCQTFQVLCKKRDLTSHQLQHRVRCQVSHWLPCDDVCISKHVLHSIIFSMLLLPITPVLSDRKSPDLVIG